MEMFAPGIDDIISSLENHSTRIDPGTFTKLKAIYHEMSCIKPVDDDLRELWIEVSRGTIKDFGSFEEYRDEGLVETLAEFEREWKDYYPDEKKWYGFATAKYREEMFFYFNSRLIFTFGETNESDTDEKCQVTEISGFLDWLSDRVIEETGKLKQDVDGYNKYLEKNLSFDKRTGRIKRRKFWDILGGEAIRLDEHLGPNRINTLEKLVYEQQKNDESAIIPEISAGDYFGYCEICYDAVDYFRDAQNGLSTEEKYRRMADGRDGGLISIERNSNEAFREWYHGGVRTGAHPWEICRGGNSTHISLMVSDAGNNWTLWLAGSSVVRVEETVKIATALYKNNIPFILHQAREILNMVTGDDYIGIVPDHVTPVYCHSLFPAEDRIIDFMNLVYENKEEMIINAYWYPLKMISTLPGI